VGNFTHGQKWLIWPKFFFNKMHHPVLLISFAYAASGVLKNGDLAGVISKLEARNYPAVDQVVPVNPNFLNRYDLSKVPDLTLATPYASTGPVDCTWRNQNTCSWGCGGCSRDEIFECPDKRNWAMTFDDGPSASTPGLLDSLKNLGNVKATFFVTGSSIVKFPDVLKRVYNDGHQIW
jgi:hypothetical protein